MKQLLFIVLFFTLTDLLAQVEISGTISDVKGNPIPGTNIYFAGTYEGTTSGADGEYLLKTNLTGIQNLIVSYIGYTNFEHEVDLSKVPITIDVLLVEETNEIDGIVITAGSFEASDTKKAVLLTPMDIATTPSAQGDIYGALAALPGTQKVGESGKIFVRGGESYETKTYIDGMMVQSPYFSNMPDVPTRGRFSPLLFSGTIFSTGGYSAEYGQALSSVVALNTNDIETKDKTSISLMTVGVNAAHVECWDNTSLAITGEYINSTFHNLIFKQEVEWFRAPVIADGTLMFRQKIGKNGMLKSFGVYNYNSMRMNYENFELNQMENINLINNNIYLNTTYEDLLSQKWMLESGIAYNFDREDVDIDTTKLVTNKTTQLARIAFTNFTSKNVLLKMGMNFSSFQYGQHIRMEDMYNLTFNNNQFSAFLESEITVSKKIAARVGGRAEFNSLLKEVTFMPRLSAAYKTGSHSQISIAYGIFYQRPEDDYLKINPGLISEKSYHYILNYQYQHNLRTFRIEAYLKEYSNLIKFNDQYSGNPDDYSNSGNGNARGIDLFWRDKRTFKDTDYWISYSFINSKRNYKDYPILATPHFVSAHNLSLVYKRFFTAINTYVGATYSYASGRPYHDPNTQNFMNGKTKSYNDISLGITYLTSVFKKEAILHLMVNNILGFENVYGYRYRSAPDEIGAFESKAIRPPVQRQAVFLISILL